MRAALVLALIFAPTASSAPTAKKKPPTAPATLERVSGPVTHVRGKKETEVSGETPLRPGDVVRLGGEARAELRVAEARTRLLPGSEIALGRSAQAKSAPWVELRKGALEMESSKTLVVQFDSARVSVEVTGGVVIVDHSVPARVSVLSGAARVKARAGEPVALKAGEVARFSAGLLDGVPEHVGVEQIRAYRTGLGF